MGYHIGVATSTPAHGTRQGYAWHLRHDRPACQECRKANAEYSRGRRASKGGTGREDRS